LRARIEGADATTIAEEFIAHARDSHDRPYPEEANYAVNFAETTVRLTGPAERLPEIGEVTVHPASQERRLDPVLRPRRLRRQSRLGLLLLPGTAPAAGQTSVFLVSTTNPSS
jgi:hypothetical protein